MLFPHIRNRTNVLLCSILSAASSTSYAFTETDLFDDIPEISSATRISQNLAEVPISSTVISEELIKASGALDIPDLMRLVPGFQVYHPNANKFAVTYHGGSGEFPRDLEVRINGRPVYIPLLSTVAWNTLGISIHDIRQIEVIRGSNVPSYGSNALMGAINIVTKSPIAASSNQVGTSVGAQGRRNFNGSFNGSSNNLFYRVSLAREMNEGFDFQKDGEQLNLGNIHLTFTPTLYDSIDFSAGFNRGTMGIGNGRHVTDFQDREHTSHFQHLRWNHSTLNGHELSMQLYHNYLNLSTPTYQASTLLGDPGLTQFNSVLGYMSSVMGGAYPFTSSSVSDFYVNTNAEVGKNHVYGGELQHLFSPFEALTLASGLGFRYEKSLSTPLLNSESYIDEETYFLFSNAEWKQTKKLTWNAGFMSEFTTKVRPATSTRLGANYQLNDNFTLRGAITQAYRTPSLLEKNAQSTYIFPEGVPYDYIVTKTDHLDSEKLIAAELGAFWKLPQYNGYIDVKLYQEKITNGIGSRFYEGPYDMGAIASALRSGQDINDVLTQIYTGSFIGDEARESWNADYLRNHGLELQASLRPRPDTLLHFAYGYNEINGVQRRGQVQGEGGYPGKVDLLFDGRAPQHTATLLLNRQFSPSVDASLIFNYMSDVVWKDSVLSDGLKTVDAKLTHTLPIGSKKQLTSSILVKNIFNEQYSEFQEKNNFERRLYLLLSMDF